MADTKHTLFHQAEWWKHEKPNVPKRADQIANGSVPRKAGEPKAPPPNDTLKTWYNNAPKHEKKTTMGIRLRGMSALTELPTIDTPHMVPKMTARTAAHGDNRKVLGMPNAKTAQKIIERIVDMITCTFRAGGTRNSNASLCFWKVARTSGEGPFTNNGSDELSFSSVMANIEIYYDGFPPSTVPRRWLRVRNGHF